MSRRARSRSRSRRRGALPIDPLRQANPRGRSRSTARHARDARDSGPDRAHPPSGPEAPLLDRRGGWPALPRRGGARSPAQHHLRAVHAAHPGPGARQLARAAPADNAELGATCDRRGAGDFRRDVVARRRRRARTRCELRSRTWPRSSTARRRPIPRLWESRPEQNDFLRPVAGDGEVPFRPPLSDRRSRHPPPSWSSPKTGGSSSHRSRGALRWRSRRDRRRPRPALASPWHWSARPPSCRAGGPVHRRVRRARRPREWDCVNGSPHT